MLHLVAPSTPCATEQSHQRVKRMARPDGMLQCARCGGRTALTTVNGAMVKNGRVHGGTVIAKMECAECWRRGIFSPMLRPLEPVQ